MPGSLLAKLPPEDARRVLAMAAASLKSRVAAAPDAGAWRAHPGEPGQARIEQCPPTNWKRIWYIRGGRGGGKTWTGANMLAEKSQTEIGRYGIVAPTYADARDKCVEGISGILAAFGTTRAAVEAGRSRLVTSWNRSLHDLQLRNGSSIIVDGADDGAPTIQGENLTGLWADEVGLWKKWEMAWEEAIRYAVRIGSAQIIATGTPKRGHPLVQQLMADDEVVKTLVRMVDNRDNLAPALVDELISKYGGTTLGRQELDGEMMDDVPGALWSRDLITRQRVNDTPTLQRIVTAIDPAASTAEGSAETGIVVAGASRVEGHGMKPKPHDHFFILDDMSIKASPNGWASQAVTGHNKYKGDRVVAEKNNGGDMVESTLRNVAPSIPYRGVTASKGKIARAEPIAALFEQGCAFIVGVLSDMEDQMCSYVAADGQPSPDRYDAMVWALTDLSSQPDPGVLGYMAQQLADKNAAKAQQKG